MGNRSTIQSIDLCAERVKVSFVRAAHATSVKNTPKGEALLGAKARFAFRKMSMDTSFELLVLLPGCRTTFVSRSHLHYDAGFIGVVSVFYISHQTQKIHNAMGNHHGPQPAGSGKPIGEDKPQRNDADDTGSTLIQVVGKANSNTGVYRKKEAAPFP